MECGSSKNVNASIAAIIFSISIGVLFGYLFTAGIVPYIIYAARIALGFGVIALGFLWVTLALATFDHDHCEKRRLKSLSKTYLFAAIGTFFVSTASIVNGLTATTDVLVGLLVGINAFFFMLLIIEVVALFMYMIDRV